jgi:copper homeostasis protein
MQGLLDSLEAGADRIELCSGLECGGVTPSLGFIEAAVALLQDCSREVRLHVLIRLRSGDFVYDDAEIAVMTRDIELLPDGVHGVVIGCLTPAGEIDAAALSSLAEAAIRKRLAVTLHRAVDASVISPVAMLVQALAAAPIDYVLSSGGAETALQGVETLRLMAAELSKLEATGRHTTLIAAGSITPECVGLLVSMLGDKVEVHASASRLGLNGLRAIVATLRERQGECDSN